MPKLPLEIEDLIWHYIGAFQIVTCWPKKQAMRRLVRKTNSDIIGRYFRLICEYNHISANSTMVMLDVENILNNQFQSIRLMQAIDESIRCYSLTSAMKWTFFDKGLYKIPRFFDIFKESVLFNVIQRSLQTV